MNENVRDRASTKPNNSEKNMRQMCFKTSIHYTMYTLNIQLMAYAHCKIYAIHFPFGEHHRLVNSTEEVVVVEYYINIRIIVFSL